eukprot:11170283-Heterocapsa_arctica.AAC.1
MLLDTSCFLVGLNRKVTLRTQLPARDQDLRLAFVDPGSEELTVELGGPPTTSWPAWAMHM